MTTLLIARHGNTFAAGKTPTRVGARTDLPLVASGQEQAQKIGAWLKSRGIIPDIVYSSQLKRTIQTADLALQTLGDKQPVYPLDIFNEIDYGVDENMTEDKVIARIGAEAIAAWDKDGIVPAGWEFDPAACIQNWQNFAAQLRRDNQGDSDDVALVVTSNGIARFAPHITGDFEGFARAHDIKLSTGAMGMLKFEDGKWHVVGWNIRP